VPGRAVGAGNVIETTRCTDTFDRVVSRLPTRLPASSRLSGSDGCYEVTFSVRLSDGVIRVYEPCIHPRSIVPALRSNVSRLFRPPHGSRRRGVLSPPVSPRHTVRLAGVAQISPVAEREKGKHFDLVDGQRGGGELGV
jgi:hypothetical protein